MRSCILHTSLLDSEPMWILINGSINKRDERRGRSGPDRAKKDLGSASAATLFFPGFYSMEKSKPKNIWSHFCCSGVWMVCSVSDSNNEFLTQKIMSEFCYSLSYCIKFAFTQKITCKSRLNQILNKKEGKSLSR